MEITQELMDSLAISEMDIMHKISDVLNIGRPNAKTFLKRINLLRITKEELGELICKVKLEV